MFVSVIICTIRREEITAALLNCLHRQSWRSAEILVVGAPDQPEVSLPASNGRLPVRYLPAPKGLAAARNVGLEKATGDIICFLDDDMLLEPDFLANAAEVLKKPEHGDVGGITGYDTLHYAASVDMRWRLRYWLGTAPSLNGGDASHLGRSVPFSLLAPFSGFREVKWLPGLCQIFRREAVQGLKYDEQIIVEDRDFSMEVGAKWRLLACGDLRFQHLRDGEARYPNHIQTARASFGMARSFGKRRRTNRDWFTMFHVLAGEVLIDCLAAARRPSITNARVPLFRIKGFVQGLSSVRGSS